VGWSVRPKSTGNVACEVCDLAHLAGGAPAVLDLSKNPLPRNEEPAPPAIAAAL